MSEDSSPVYTQHSQVTHLNASAHFLVRLSTGQDMVSEVGVWESHQPQRGMEEISATLRAHVRGTFEESNKGGEGSISPNLGRI